MGNEPKVSAEGIRFHTKQSDPKAEENSRESNLEGAAKALIINFNGYKGSGENVYIQTADGKLKVKDVSVWMDKLDVNKDGTITTEELKKGGGDKYNILKLNSDEKTQQKVSESIYAQQILGGMEGMGKGLNAPSLFWGMAKGYIIDYNSKQSLKDMFEVPEVRNYYNKELWGITPDEVEDNESAREHMREIFQHFDFTAQELKDLKFTDAQVKFFMQKK